jgi:hypothetical protein
MCAVEFSLSCLFSFRFLLLLFAPCSLLDDFIRSRQHVRRNRYADLFGCIQVDDQLKLRWLLHRQISGLGTF